MVREVTNQTSDAALTCEKFKIVFTQPRPGAALKLLSKAAINARFTGAGDVQSTCDKRSTSGPPNRRPNDESVYLRARDVAAQAFQAAVLVHLADRGGLE